MSARVIEFDADKVDAIFREFDQCHLPGAAVGISLGGRPVYRKGFGLASMELPVVLSPTIRMRIGSTSKHFACLAYLLLCEEGRAGIDDAIGTYLPELHPVARRVTARQLMGNLGGLRDVFDIVWQFSGTARPVSSAELLSMYRDIDDANAEPGTTWMYNNGGFLLLSTAIERIAGQTLEEVLRERIFEPIGMYATLLRRSETGFVANSATLHMRNAAGEYERSTFYGTAFAGEGGIVSTIDDMLRWLAHMDAPVVGTAQTWRIMKTPQQLANGTSSGYGLGLLIDRYRGIETISHPGGGMGGNAQMLKIPAVGLDMVVMVNRDESGILLGNKIIDACLAGLDAAKEASRHSFINGTYRSSMTGRVVQLFPQEGLQTASIDGADMQVAPDEKGVLQPAGISSYVKQTMTPLGEGSEPAAIRLDDYGTIDELVRQELSKPIAVETISGRYRSETTATEMTIGNSGDGPRMTTVGRFGTRVYLLECLADGLWRAKPTWVSPRCGGIVSFDRDGAALRFSSNRTLSLVFRRSA